MPRPGCGGSAHRACARGRIDAKTDEAAAAPQTGCRRESIMALEVTYDRKVCIHSANCVKSLPQVFKVENGKFVIDPAAAPAEKVRATVAACPSGALKLKE
jgi:uncharacterized Fe-S cluster protein YjdI